MGTTLELDALSASECHARAATLVSDRRAEAAVPFLRRACELAPNRADYWAELFPHVTAIGTADETRWVQANFLQSPASTTPLKRAAEAFVAGRLPESEFLCRLYLRTQPTDSIGLRLLAELAFWQGRETDCVTSLEECLRIDPEFPGARFRLAVALHRLGRVTEARTQTAELLRDQPRDTSARFLMATILAQTGGDAESAEIYSALVAEYPSSMSLWMSFANVLKTSGQQVEALRAYRRVIELDPNSGMAWWSLSNFKTVRFTPEDLATMRSRLRRTDVTAEQRLHFEFALGKACEDLEDYTAAFSHYAEGNRLRRAEAQYESARVSTHVTSIRRSMGQKFFRTCPRSGLADRSPIFVCGLPRSGSTLIEQILSSHSQVEGTSELPYMGMMVRREFGSGGEEGGSAEFAERVAARNQAELRELGERYLAAAAAHRMTDRPFFIDKALNNFFNVGIIDLILPGAKIIDARRHPLGCGFSNFKQLFVRGQWFAYSLRNIGLYYRDYVSLMAHWDAVLPGRVHRVFYERMVQDTEAEIRRLLDYCGLPFEESCLAFYENRRAVRTVSSEQVRRPINTEGMDQWRHFEPWLDELKTSLGSVLESYPEIPADLRDPTTGR